MRLRRYLPSEPNVFAYWNSADQHIIADFVAEWQAEFPKLRIVGDDDVARMLAAMRPDAPAMFRRLRFPSARSDLARLAGLHQLGGLYVDVHIGLTDPQRLRRLLRDFVASPAEMLIWDRSRTVFPRPAAERRPVSTITAAKRGSTVLNDLLDHVLHNLDERAVAESAGAVGEYDVWRVCGAGSWRSLLHDPADGNTTLRAPYAGRVTYVPEDDGPVTLWRHGTYRKTTPHWSKRQHTEPLLTVADAAEDPA